MQNTLAHFLKLVTIDSPSGQEQEMAAFLTQWLKAQGFACKADKLGNIYASKGGTGEPLLLCAHMDTVDPGHGIKPKVENGMVKSSGDTILGSDNKAAVASIMAAVEESKGRSLEILFTVKEETGGGVEFFPFEWVKAKEGVVLDSSLPLGGIIMRSTFIESFNATITGKASHASRPEEGVNAFLPAFAAFPTIPLGRLDNGETTVNIGKILGGTGINTIPGQINIHGEVRSYSKDYFEARMANIKSILMNAAAASGCTCDFKTEGFCPGYTHKESDPMVLKVAQIYKDLGLETVHHMYSGVSDANIINDRGIKTLNLTFGGQFVHTTAEQIAVADLEKLKDIVVSCINKL